MMQDEQVTQLELEDALNRAARARLALVTAVQTLPEERFLEGPLGEWSAGRVLRHLA